MDIGTQDSTLPIHITGKYLNGSGIEGDPYLIEDAEDLFLLAELVNAGNYQHEGTYYELTKNIDLSDYGVGKAFNGGKGWIPIGYNMIIRENNHDRNTYSFKGHFDGKDKTITGLSIDNPYVDDNNPGYHFTGLLVILYTAR